MGNSELPTPRVAIAIPAYLAAGTLEATLRSCQQQTLEDWVGVVTVDSDDASAEEEVVKRLADPRIFLERNGRQLGQFGNFNRAILRCLARRPRWVKLLCADDVLYPDALERMVQRGEAGAPCGLVFGYFDCIDETGRLTATVDLSQTRTEAFAGPSFLAQLFSHGLYNPVGGPSSVMLSADALQHVGVFDDRLNYAGDAVLWYRIMTHFPVGIVGERAIVRYRFHTNSVTGRGFTSPERFIQPADIARSLVATQPPFSKLWWHAQHIAGTVLASNLFTALALARRGELRAAAIGTLETLRRANPMAAPSMLAALVMNGGRLVLGLLPRRIGPLAPPFVRVTPRR